MARATASKLPELLRIARERFDQAWEADRENRDEALDDLKTLAGDQWDPDVKREREDDNRPCPVENRLPQFVEQIVGDIRQQKPAAKVRPVDDVADPKVAEVMTSLLRDIEGRSINSQPYVKAAESAVQCGIGHFRILTKYSRIGAYDQEVVMEPIDNPFAVVWDPLARQVTRADAGYCFVTQRMARKDFEAAYPRAPVVDFADGDLPESYEGLKNWYDTDTVRVCEYWYKEPLKRRFARLQTGQVIELEKDDEAPEGADVREVDDFKVCMALISGLEVLGKPVEWITPDIPIIPVIGKEVNIGERVVRWGAIRFAKDPQRRYNIWLATQTELLGLQPKAPFLATPAQIKGFEGLWKDANTKNRPVLFYNPDAAAQGAPQRVTPPVASQGVMNEIMMAADAMKATTGIYDASLGAQSNETSGKAINARTQQTATGSYLYTDNLTASVRHAGQIILDIIPKIYDRERVVRLLNEDGSEVFERVNVPFMETDEKTGEMVEGRRFDMTVGRYDLVISTGPAYATKRQEAADSMMQFLQTMPEQAQLVMDLIVKNFDWPGADEMAERFQKALPPALQPKNEEPTEEDMIAAKAAEKKQQLEDAQIGIALRQGEAEATEAEASAEKAQFEAMQTQLEFMIQSGALDGMIRQHIGEMQASPAPLPQGSESPMGELAPA